ncbi:MAG: flippase-like domain-containing protein [Prevotellaceae bacterium]|jgi:uncharacterized protein (TIRG00374 family)|nr:flippase-like domain-containing protein [Prevotellaceae bacterium]
MKKWNPVFFAIGIIAVGYMIYDTGIDLIWANIQKTGIWFLPVIGVWLAVYLINALAWNLILHDRDTPENQLPSFLNVFRITVSGYAINYITPVINLGGEPYRIFELKDKIGINKATSKVLSYSMMHVLSHIVFWIVSIALIIAVLNPPAGIVAACILALVFFLFFLYFLFRGYRKGMIVKLFRILGKLPFIRQRISRLNEKKLATFQEIDANIVQLYSSRKTVFYSALLLEILARTVSCLELLFIGRAIEIDMSMIDAIVLYAGSTLFYNIMFFAPMQLGTREGGMALTLSTMGFAASAGLYIGLVTRIRELFWICIGMILMKCRF